MHQPETGFMTNNPLWSSFLSKHDRSTIIQGAITDKVAQTR